MSESAAVPTAEAPGAWRGRVARYLGGSVIAFVCSEVVFVLTYGVLGLAPGWSSTLSWVAGAVPNYWLNRTWTWRRSGRASLRREVLPYVAIVLATLLLATLATHGADALLTNAHTEPDLRVLLVDGAFLGVYVVMFVLRYFLLDRLFARVEPAQSPADASDRLDPTSRGAS